MSEDKEKRRIEEFKLTLIDIGYPEVAVDELIDTMPRIPDSWLGDSAKEVKDE